MHGVRLWKLKIKIIGKFFASLFQKKPLLDFQYSPLYAKLLNLRHKMKKTLVKKAKNRVCESLFRCSGCEGGLFGDKRRLACGVNKASSVCKRGLFAGWGVRCCVSEGCAVVISLFLGIAPFVQSG